MVGKLQCGTEMTQTHFLVLSKDEKWKKHYFYLLGEVIEKK